MVGEGQIRGGGLEGITTGCKATRMFRATWSIEPIFCNTCKWSLTFKKLKINFLKMRKFRHRATYTRIMGCEDEGRDQDHQGLPANLQKLGGSPWNRSAQPSERTNPDDTLISAFQTPRLWDNELLKQNKRPKTTGTEGATAEVSFPEYPYRVFWLQKRENDWRQTRLPLAPWH